MKIIAFAIIIIAGMLVSGCYKLKEYCWECQGYEYGVYFEDTMCGYTEEEMDDLLANPNDSKDFIDCQKQ